MKTGNQIDAVGMHNMKRDRRRRGLWLGKICKFHGVRRRDTESIEARKAVEARLAKAVAAVPAARNFRKIGIFERMSTMFRRKG